MLSWFLRWVGQFAIGSFAMAVRALLTPVAFGVIAIIVEPGGKVALVRHSYRGGLSFPGGGVGRGEPAITALLRELREEIGPVKSDPPMFFGLYTRRSGWATNVIAVYRLMNAEVEFRPKLEVRELVFIDPANPPKDTQLGTLRRLAEHLGKTPPNPFW